MSTASISRVFSIRSQKEADSLLDALVRSGKKSKAKLEYLKGGIDELSSDKVVVKTMEELEAMESP